MKQPPRCPETEKVSYRTRKKALRAAAGRSRGAGVKLTVYDCNHCEYWHLTSKVERTREERRIRREKRRKEAELKASPSFSVAKVTPLHKPEQPGRKGTVRERMEQIKRDRTAAEGRQMRSEPGTAAYNCALDDIARCRREWLECDAELRLAA